MDKLLSILCLLGILQVAWVNTAAAAPGLAEMTCESVAPKGGSYVFQQREGKILGTWYEHDGNSEELAKDLPSTLKSKKLADGKCQTDISAKNKNSRARISLVFGRETDYLEEFVVGGKDKRPIEPLHQVSCKPNPAFVSLLDKSCKLAKAL